MGGHNARVYTSRRQDDLEAEMTRIGAEWAGVIRMLPKAEHYVIKLDNVRTPAALILKEEMLAKGGDAAIHRDCITGRIEHSDVLLMGTGKVFDQVIHDLHDQQFSLPEIADEITLAIENYRSPISLMPSPSELPVCLQSFYSTMRERTLIMGILNVTPDSFSDGGLYVDKNAAIERGLEMIDEGADVIDIGGESSRPGAEPVPVEEELARVVPIIQELSKRVSVPISIDTYKPEVARAALDAGASIINDITGLVNPLMRALAAERKVPVIIMHMKGNPQTMQDNPVYEDVVSEVMKFLRQRTEQVVEAGLPEEYVIIDPGIGFGKTVEHNLEIIYKLRDFKSLGSPILIGTSRKSFIGKILGGLPPTGRLEGTAATVAISIANGANIVRVHDVKQMAKVARMTDAIVRFISETQPLP
ncbi:MAG: dihydropteroate synthase [Armatimonadetes bacterium]|nr:dihydropteroate synthase [Armatimonadota bacterium]